MTETRASRARKSQNPRRGPGTTPRARDRPRGPRAEDSDPRARVGRRPASRVDDALLDARRDARGDRDLVRTLQHPVLTPGHIATASFSAAFGDRATGRRATRTRRRGSMRARAAPSVGAAPAGEKDASVGARRPRLGSSTGGTRTTPGARGDGDDGRGDGDGVFSKCAIRQGVYEGTRAHLAHGG